MNKKERLSKSLRKFIRQEKSRICRDILDLEKQKQSIGELYKKFHKVKEEKIQKNPEVK